MNMIPFSLVKISPSEASYNGTAYKLGDKTLQLYGIPEALFNKLKDDKLIADLADPDKLELARIVSKRIDLKISNIKNRAKAEGIPVSIPAHLAEADKKLKKIKADLKPKKTGGKDGTA